MVAQRIIETVGATALSAEGVDLHVTASVGIALYPSDGGNERELMAHADAAMYHTKNNGRNGYTFFAPSMNASHISVHTVFTPALCSSVRALVHRLSTLFLVRPASTSSTWPVSPS